MGDHRVWAEETLGVICEVVGPVKVLAVVFGGAPADEAFDWKGGDSQSVGNHGIEDEAEIVFGTYGFASVEDALGVFLEKFPRGNIVDAAGGRFLLSLVGKGFFLAQFEHIARIIATEVSVIGGAK